MAVIELETQVEGEVETEIVNAGAAGDADRGSWNIELVRELARKAFTDSIPEHIYGDTYEEIMASVEASRAAYGRVFAEVSERQAAVKAPVVPAGGSSAPVVDVERLPAAEKLRRGVAGRR